MNGALLHLAFNHFPVVGLSLVVALLAVGVVRKSRENVAVAFSGLVLIGLLTAVAFLSGDPAAHRLRQVVPGIEKTRIHEHEEAAEGALGGIAVLGVLSLIGLWRMRRSQEFPSRTAVLALTGSVLAVSWAGWASHLGGLIRHPEIDSDYKVFAESREIPSSPVNPNPTK